MLEFKAVCTRTRVHQLLCVYESERDRERMRHLFWGSCEVVGFFFRSGDIELSCGSFQTPKYGFIKTVIM